MRAPGTDGLQSGRARLRRVSRARQCAIACRRPLFHVRYERATGGLLCSPVCVFVALHMSLKAYGRALSPTGSFRRNVHAPWCARTAPRAVQRWPGGSAHRWHPVPCRAVAGCTPIGALLRCRASSGGGGAGAMRLPRMRRAWARPRRPRGHPALLMVAHQGPPIAMYPPHTSATASTPAHTCASSPPRLCS